MRGKTSLEAKVELLLGIGSTKRPALMSPTRAAVLMIGLNGGGSEGTSAAWAEEDEGQMKLEQTTELG